MYAGQLLGSLMNGLRPLSTHNPTVELVPGQVFRGVITKAFPGDLVQVQIGGMSLYAQLNAPLQVGQTAWLQVLPKSNPITLKVIDTPRIPTTTQDNQSTERSSLEGLLRGLGLKADRENLYYLKQIIDADLPLKPEEIGRLLEMLKETSSPNRTLQVAQFAHMKGLPLDTEVIRSLEVTLFGKTIHEQLNILTDLSKGNTQIQGQIEKISLLWQEMRDSLISLQQHSEAQSAKNGSINSSSITTHSPQMSQSSNSLKTSQRTEKFENPIQKFINLLGVENERNLTQKMVSMTHGTVHIDEMNHFKGLLLELRDSVILSQPVKDAVEQGIRWITGQQLLLSNEGNTPWSTYVFQIPLVQLNKEIQPAFIHIQGRKKGKEAIDLENCHLFFHLDLEALDKTLIDIQIQNRIMNIQIYNDSPWLKEWIEEQKLEWVDPMKEMGYHLSNLKVSSLPQEEQEKKRESRSNLPISSYRGVDLRV